MRCSTCEARAFDDLDGLDELDSFDALDDFEDDGALGFDAFGESDEFLRVLRVLNVGRSIGGAAGRLAPLFRVAQRGLRLGQVHRALAQPGGVFLQGANSQQARSWASQLAQRLGGTVSPLERHGGGLPHFHIETPTFRSGHIFFGRPPRGSFFDAMY